MSTDRITQLRISGLRAIREATLDLKGLTVLIGDNGSGKSSVLEALEIVRQAAKPVSFVQDILVVAHGGLDALLRRGSPELRLGVTVEGDGPRLDYDFAIGNVGTSPRILSERVFAWTGGDGAMPVPLLLRAGEEVEVVFAEPYPARLVPAINAHTLALPALAFQQRPFMKRLAAAMAAIEVHVPFETRPVWLQRELGMQGGPRWPVQLDQADRLARFGLNLPIAFYRLRNVGGEVWARTLDRVRLGLGDDVRDIQMPAVGRGSIELELLFGSWPNDPIPAGFLSEGQLAYLAFVALIELNAHRALLAFDEPELHLHPMLLARVVWMLERAAETAPVILATHSDRMLDALGDPLGSVVLCELDHERATRLRKPNAERLAEWMENYRGIGSIRAEGYEAQLFTDDVDTHAAKS